MSPWTKDYMKARVEVVKKRVKARCRDFLEIVPSNDTSIASGTHPENDSKVRQPRYDKPLFWVDFLHRTVMDFFLGDDMQALLNDWMKTPFNPHLTLCGSFVMQMKILPPTKNYKNIGNASFFELVIDFLHHAREIEERYSFTASELIEEVDRVAIHHCGGTQTASNLFRPPESQGTLPPSSIFVLGGMSWKPGWIVTLSVQTGLRIFVSQILQEESDLVHGVNGCPLLHCALLFPMKGSGRSVCYYTMDMLRLLLKAGANPNQIYLGTTVWGLFLRTCYNQATRDRVKVVWSEIFALLLEHGADSEAKFKTGQSSEKPTFSGRIMKYPVYTSIPEIMEKCCPDETNRLKAIIHRKRGLAIWR